MSKEIRGKFGPIEGFYKTESEEDHVIEPCHHLIKRIKKNVFLVFHGRDDGTVSIIERKVGE